MTTGTRTKFILLVAALILTAPSMPEVRGTPVTTIYEFIPEQSTVVRTGGIAGRRYTYSIEGQFQLIVDYDAGAASFDQVNAIISEPVWYWDEGPHTTQDLNDLFHMTELESTYVSDTEIDFLLERDDPHFPHQYSDIWVRISFMNEAIWVTGYSLDLIADGYRFEIDAVAVPEPATFFLLGAGGLLLIRKRIF